MPTGSCGSDGGISVGRAANNRRVPAPEGENVGVDDTEPSESAPQED